MPCSNKQCPRTIKIKTATRHRLARSPIRKKRTVKNKIETCAHAARKEENKWRYVCTYIHTYIHTSIYICIQSAALQISWQWVRWYTAAIKIVREAKADRVWGWVGVEISARFPYGRPFALQNNFFAARLALN